MTLKEILAIEMTQTWLEILLALLQTVYLKIFHITVIKS